MPMPRISEVSAVRQSEKKIELSPTVTITRTKLVAAPVSVSVPMMVPTSAQATPTGSAWRAPSARLLSATSASRARP